jgi:hypothetical protein
MNPHNIPRSLTDCITKLLPWAVHLSDYSAEDEDVAKELYENITSVLNSSEYRFGNEHSLAFVYDLCSLSYSNETDRVFLFDMKVPQLGKIEW